MGDNPTFSDYLQGHMDRAGWSKAELARRSGIDASLIGRWLAGAATPSVERARTIADTIGRPVLEVLVAAGHLTPDEAAVDTAPADPSTLTNEQLLSEIGRRLNSNIRAIPTSRDVDRDPADFDEGSRRVDQRKGVRRTGQRRRAAGPNGV